MPAITFDEVRDRLAQLLRLPADRFTPDTTLQDLALDSFVMIEFIVDLQEEFDSIVSQDGLRTAETLGDLTALLAAGGRRA